MGQISNPFNPAKLPTTGLWFDHGSGNSGLSYNAGGFDVGLNSNGLRMTVSQANIRLTSDTAFGWSPSNGFGAANDLTLYRDAANILAQRNGTNAQSFRLYNTFTDALNGEWATFDWVTSANWLTIGTKRNGTGVGRSISIESASRMDLTAAAGQSLNFGIGAIIWAINSDGHFIPSGDNQRDFGLTANRIRRGYFAEYLEISEMAAPAAAPANKARLYSVDNGSGKTQLAVIFPSGAAQILATEP